MKVDLPIRLVPRLDKYDWAISSARTAWGKLLMTALFSILLLQFHPRELPLIAAAVLFFSFLPKLRKELLVLATLSSVLFGYTDFYWGYTVPRLRMAGVSVGMLTRQNSLIAVALVLVVCGLTVALLTRGSLARKIERPVGVLIISYLILLIAASSLPLPAVWKAVLWLFLVILGRYIWFLCYTLREAKFSQPRRVLFEVGRYLPFWHPGNVPFPKGGEYLRRIEAKNPQEQAISQLKGLKLIWWASLLSLAGGVLRVLLYGRGNLILNFLRVQRMDGMLAFYSEGERLLATVPWPFTFILPSYEAAFNLSVLGTPLPWHQNWAALVAAFFLDMLKGAVTFHVIVAIIRMCGYNALRGMYRPLTSSSLAEFWNRFYYYYKELLVHIFFYPVFFRYFKQKPALRIAAATLAAAGFGNCLFHFLRDTHFIADMGFFKALIAFQTFIFYCTVLAIAIAVSQYRLQKRRTEDQSRARRMLAPVWVLAFYCLISIFADFRRAPIMENFKFFLALFNIQVN